MNIKASDKQMRLPIKKTVAVTAAIILSALVTLTLWSIAWDGGLAISKHQMLLPAVQLNLKTVTTARGTIEYDMYGTKGPVVLSVHAGLGGADQARLFASWLQGDGFRILSPSRPGYLGTPLSSGKAAEEQADLLAALLDKLVRDAGRNQLFHQHSKGTAYDLHYGHTGQAGTL